jgi:hypothetical protein
MMLKHVGMEVGNSINGVGGEISWNYLVNWLLEDHPAIYLILQDLPGCYIVTSSDIHTMCGVMQP